MASTAVRKFDSYAGFYSGAVPRNPSNPLIDRIGLRILSLFGLLEDAFRLAAYALNFNDGSRNPWFGKEVQILTPVVPTPVAAPLPAVEPQAPPVVPTIAPVIASKDELTPQERLLDAAARGDLMALRTALADPAIEANSISDALVIAAHNEHFLIIREIFKTCGADVKKKDIEFLFSIAIMERRFMVLKELLSSGRLTREIAEAQIELILDHKGLDGAVEIHALLKHVNADGTQLISDEAARRLLQAVRWRFKCGSSEEKVILMLRSHLREEPTPPVQTPPAPKRTWSKKHLAIAIGMGVIGGLCIMVSQRYLSPSQRRFY